MPARPAGNGTLIGLTVAFWILCAWSAIDPTHQTDWWLEILTPVGLFALLASTLKLYRFTTLSYALLFAECVLLIIGAHYTHAEVPFFEPPREWWGWERNHYDRFAHFGVGVLCMIPVREVLWRCTPLRGAWLNALAIICIWAWGAAYEVIEWLLAITVDPEAAEHYLGAQGDQWDAQKDMLLDGLGGIAALVWVPWHRRQVEGATPPPDVPAVG